MAIHVALHHKTHYRYDRLRRAVAARRSSAAGAALPHADPQLLAQGGAASRISSTGSRIRTAITSARVVFPEKTRELLVEVDLVAEMSVFNPFDFFLEPSAEQFPFTYEPWLAKELAPFLEVSAGGAAAPASSSRTIDRRRDGRSISSSISTGGCRRRLRYVIRLEPGVQTPEETLSLAQRLVPRHAAGCWCRRCVTSAWPRGSSRAI